MLKYNYNTKRIEGAIRRKGHESNIIVDFAFDNLEKKPTEETLKFQQVMIYVMCGGGMLGSFAMRQPADFYIDSRVGRLPYPQAEIYKAIEVLKAMADYLQKDPHKLEEPEFFGCWVF